MPSRCSLELLVLSPRPPSDSFQPLCVGSLFPPYGPLALGRLLSSERFTYFCPLRLWFTWRFVLPLVSRGGLWCPGSSVWLPWVALMANPLLPDIVHSPGKFFPLIFCSCLLMRLLALTRR